MIILMIIVGTFVLGEFDEWTREPFYKKVGENYVSQGITYTQSEWNKRLEEDKKLQEKWIKDNVYSKVGIGKYNFENIRERSVILQKIFPIDEKEVIWNIGGIILISYMIMTLRKKSFLKISGGKLLK